MEAPKEQLQKHWLKMLEAAYRAPSAHNTQPAIFERDELTLKLFEDRSRWLSVADPNEKDHRLSLGAAFEAMSIASRYHDFDLSSPEFVSETKNERSLGQTNGIFPYLTTSLIPRSGGIKGDKIQQEYHNLLHRTSYRKPFIPRFEITAQENKDWDQGLQKLSEEFTIQVVRDPEQIKRFAEIHDDCTYEFVKDPKYYQELYDWLRFNRSNQNYFRDGLSGEAMGLQWYEKIAGPVVMHPIMFKLWNLLGFAKELVAEKNRTETSSYLVFLYEDKSVSDFDIGRTFLKLWNAFEGMGLSACPMSTLADSDLGKSSVLELLKHDPTKQLVNVFRCGKAGSPVALSSRRFFLNL